MSSSEGVRISIGLLAHNEEDVIGGTLHSLLEQSIVLGASCAGFRIESLELVCIPNGCSDRTEEIATETLKNGATAEHVTYRVKAYPVGGKARAWNSYVHEVSSDQADFLVLMDADIRFASPDVLEMLVERLLHVPSAVVSTDQAVKATKLKSSHSAADRISLAASQQVSTDNAITGQLYCARASELRRIWMPLDLPVEDGFLAAMILTEGFTRKERIGVISKVPQAIHYYEVHEDLAGFLRHEQRIVVGSVINSWIFTVLWKEGRSGHVGNYIRERNEQKPAWVDDLVSAEVQTRGIWVVPKSFVLKRLYVLSGLRPVAFIKQSPIAILATFLQMAACILANRTLRRSGASRFW